uniref:proline-rich protein 2-like n=1 Tax=Odobenus rosmarus divergens TaxID=9708 RepID=UPI00063CD876|nr:PREDICTED: proline-rich protein 2-like [Odobenus rosmarus divergens]
MPAAGPLSPGSALQKRLLVTGRERRQPRAHAQLPPPGHTHTRTRCRRLPPPPAGFLPLRGPGCSGGLRHASDPAPTRPPFPIRVRRLQPASPLPSSPPSLPPTPLQLLATPLRQPATPVPGPGPAFGPAQRAPPPSPRQPAGASPPLSAGAAPSAAATHCAGLRAGRPEGRSSGSADPSCSRAGLPPPAAGMPRAAGPRATSAVERSGSAPARGTASCWGLRDRRRWGWERWRTSSDLEAAALIRVSGDEPQPPSSPPRLSGVPGPGRTQIPGLAKAGRPCNSGLRQHGLGSGRKNHATRVEPGGERRVKG